MIKFVIETAPLKKGGTIKDLQHNLPLMVSNGALEQIQSRLEEKYSNLRCEDHPDHNLNTVILSIPGGDVTKQNSMNFNFSGFCCEKFHLSAKDIIFEDYRTNK